jgi:purine-binding chemotaxis protein CheW
VALVVDAVATLESPDTAQREQATRQLGTDTTARLLGAFPIAGSQRVARILDIRALLEAAFARRARALPPRPRESASASGAQRQAQAQAPAQMLVTFEVAGQEFALPLAAVREILPAPAEVTVVAHADAAVLGITAARDRLLPLLSLRALLGFGAAPQAQERRKVVVMNIGGTPVGLVADRARAIVAADSALVDPVPPVPAARTGGESRIHSVYRGEGGRRLIAILSPEQLFRNEVMQQLTGKAGTAPDAEAVAVAGAELTCLVFRLGEDEFGLPIDSVVEVAQVPAQITRVPRTPKFLEGVVNLRGEVLPIVDQRRRFEMPPAPAGSARRLVVVRTERHRAGLIVDGVAEVLRTSAAEVQPPPELTDATARLVSGVLNLAQSRRIVLLLDPSELLTRAEQGLLDAFEASRRKAGA